MDNTPEKHYMKVKDHSVSGEVFELVYNEQYDMLQTSPQPQGAKLAKYYESDDYISHTDASRTLVEKMYQLVKRYALKSKASLIEGYSKSGKLLDIGAGTGDFGIVMKGRGWNVAGYEPSVGAAGIAREKGLELINDFEEINDASVNVITMWHVLEHVPDVNGQLQEIYRMLKPGGHVFIAVPNFNSYDARHYKQNWAAFDVPRHLWHFSRQSIKRLAGEHSFKVLRVHPMKFDSFYVSLLSEKYKTGSNNLIQAFWQGLRSNIAARKNNEYSSLIYVLKKQ